MNGQPAMSRDKRGNRRMESDDGASSELTPAPLTDANNEPGGLTGSVEAWDLHECHIDVRAGGGSPHVLVKGVVVHS